MHVADALKAHMTEEKQTQTVLSSGLFALVPFGSPSPKLDSDDAPAPISAGKSISSDDLPREPGEDAYAEHHREGSTDSTDDKTATGKSCQDRAAAIVGNPKFDRVILAAILINAIFMVTGDCSNPPPPLEAFVFECIDFFFYVIFLVSLLSGFCHRAPITVFGRALRGDSRTW